MWSLKKLSPALAALSTAIVLTACSHPQRVAAPGEAPPSGGLYEGIIGFYTGPLNHIEGVRRGSCPMYPSCSQYSRQAVARHGMIKGWVMTMDRLMRCGRDELKTAPRIFAQGDWRYYDPVAQKQIPTLANEPTVPDAARKAPVGLSD